MTDTNNSPPPPPPPPPASPPPPPSPPPSPPPPAANWYEADGIATDNRTFVAKNGYKSVDDALTAARHLETFVGADKATLLRLPKDMTDRAALAPIFTQLGLPADATGYALKPDDKVGLTEPILASFSTSAHKLNLLPWQVQGIINDWYLPYQKEMNEKFEQGVALRHKESEAIMQREFGAAYEDRVNRANDLIEKYGGEELGKWLEENGLGNDPRMIRFIDKLADLVAENPNLPGESGRDNRAGKLTPAEAEAKLHEFEQANMAALSNRGHADHKAVVAKREELIKAAYPPPPPPSS